MSFGVEPSDGPGCGDIFDALDAALDRALHLGLDTFRYIDARSRPAGTFILALPPRTTGARHAMAAANRN